MSSFSGFAYPMLICNYMLWHLYIQHLCHCWGKKSTWCKCYITCDKPVMGSWFWLSLLFPPLSGVLDKCDLDLLHAELSSVLPFCFLSFFPFLPICSSAGDRDSLPDELCCIDKCISYSVTHVLFHSYLKSSNNQFIFQSVFAPFASFCPSFSYPYARAVQPID